MTDANTGKLLLGRWVDRLLLLGILALQVVVLLRLSVLLGDGRHIATPPESVRATVGARPTDETVGGGRAIARMQPFAVGGGGPYLAGDPFGDVFGQMNAAMWSAMRDMERMSDLMRRDDGWDAMRASPAMDMRELNDAYVVVFSLPAVSVDDVQVILDGRLLSVVTPFGRDGEAAPYPRHRQLVQLPGPVGDVEQASASLTNGLLRVIVPKGQPPVDHRRSFRLY